ncbi:MAG: ion transporter, partial [Pseudohongiella sp.]
EGVSRPVMEVYPYAWVYFISFVLVTAFVVLNLFIGIIVSTMQERHFEDESLRQAEQDQRAHNEREEMLRLIRELNDKVDRLQR